MNCIISLLNYYFCWILVTNKVDQDDDDDCPSDSTKKLSAINSTVSSKNIEAMNTLFECSELSGSDDAQYFDLLLNPEGYTGLIAF